jgi:hypothetical protein
MLLGRLKSTQIAPRTPTGTAFLCRQSERGVVAIETAIIAVIFFGIIGLIIDLGLGWFRASNLNSVASDSARLAAQSLFSSRGESCATVESRIATDAVALYNRKYAVSAATFTASIVLTGDRRVQINGSIPLDCIFCNALPNGITLRTQADAMIEHGGFTCTR